MPALILVGNKVMSSDLIQWTSTESLPVGLSSKNLVSYNDRLYIIGGKNSQQQPVDTVYVATITEDGGLSNWNAAESLLRPLYLHATVVVQDYIYVIGGYDGSRRGEILRTQILNDGTLAKWVKVGEYPLRIVSHSAVAVNETIYVAGGQDPSGQIITDSYQSTVGADGMLSPWERSIQLPIPLIHHTVQEQAGQIYLIGGLNNDDIQRSVYRATVDSSANIGGWQQLADFPLNIYQHRSVVHDGRIVILGGKITPSIETASIYSARILPDGQLETWMAEPSLPLPLYRFGAVSVSKYDSDYIFVAGGISNNVYQGGVYHSQIPSPPPPTAGISKITLQNNPQTALQPGDIVTYTVQIQNGQEALSGLVVTNTLPLYLTPLPESIRPQESITWGHTLNGSDILWEFKDESFPANQPTTFSIAGQLPSLPPTPEPEGLTIYKTAPLYAPPTSIYSYMLRVTNHTTHTLTQVQITDTVPSDIFIRNPGGGTVMMPNLDKLIWPAPDQPMMELAPMETLTRTFEIFLTREIDNYVINKDYMASALISGTTESLYTSDPMTVTTYIVPTGPLPTNSITNQGVCVSWIYNGTADETCGQSRHNPHYDMLLPLVR